MRKLFATFCVAAGLAGFMAATPAASADPLVHFDSNGDVDPSAIGSGEFLACVDPFVKVFGNVLLDDPICV